MKLKNNILLFYLINFLESCVFLIPIWYFFFVSYLNFWIGDAILISTISWLITLLLEVHSWGWADRFGRKKMYIIGLFLWITGFSFYLWSTEVYLFLIWSVFFWIWYALRSWNLEALIHDNLEEDGRVEDYNNIQSNQYIILFSWRAISSLWAWYLFFYNELYPALASIICLTIATILVFFLHSPKQNLSEESTDIKHIRKAITFLIERKELMFMIIFW